MSEDTHLLTTIWQRLEDATTRRTQFTLGFLGTADVAGVPHVRAVILREFDHDHSVLSFSTHARSTKVTQIHGNPQVALTLYDADAAVQLRLEGTAVLVSDRARRLAAWQNLGPHSRAMFRSAVAPGTELLGVSNATRAPEHDSSTLPLGSAEDAAAFDQFAWVDVRMQHVDWVDLSRAEHLRYAFSRQGSGWAATRLVP